MRSLYAELPADPAPALPEATDFIREIVNADILSGKYRMGDIRTRFRRNPTAISIGHAKALYIDFGIARDYHGNATCAWTTPTSKEDVEYVEAIRKMSAGSALNGMAKCAMPRITLSKCTTMRS